MTYTYNYYKDDNEACYIEGTVHSFLRYSDMEQLMQEEVFNRNPGDSVVFVEVPAPKNLYAMIENGALLW